MGSGLSGCGDVPSFDWRPHQEAALSAPRRCVAARRRAPTGFDARVEGLRKATGVPGLAIAMLEGRTTLARGHGVRRIGSPEPVDGDTLFATGSTGRAIITAALATLVDAGRIGWDDRVIDYLPGSQMYDPWVTREITIRDLLVHRSGLGLGQATCCSCRGPTCRTPRWSAGSDRPSDRAGDGPALGGPYPRACAGARRDDDRHDRRGPALRDRRPCLSPRVAERRPARRR